MNKKNNQKIIDNFIDTFPTVKDGLDHLNERLGTSYKHNSISVWRKEKERPGVRAYELMAKRVLEKNGHKEIFNMIKLDF